MAPDPVKLRKQVDYYFSDSNFPRDKFLRQKSEEDEDGYVDISVLLTFNRLKVLGATVDEISRAASTSKIVVLDDSKKRLRRKDPLPDANLWKTRSLYAKGWTAGSEFPSIDTLISLFSPSGEVLMVKRRFWNDDDGKHFKGSIFIEFATPEMAERAAAEEYSIQVKDAESGKMVDKKLIALMCEEYFAKKKEETRLYRQRKNELKKQSREKKSKDKDGDANGAPKEASNGNGVGAGDGEEKGEGKVEDKAEDVKAELKSEAKVEGSTAADVKSEGKKENRPETVRGNLIRGLVVRFEGIDPDVSRTDIREAFKEHGDVTWVAHNGGETEGFVRYAEIGMAAKAVGNKTEVKGNALTLKVLEGEEEETYWNGVWDVMDRIEESRKRKLESGGNGGGRRGRGGWKRRRGGGGYRGGRGRGRK